MPKLSESIQPVALTVAGSDSGAGAGIQADLKTFAAYGVYACSVLTLVTAQSTQAVDAIEILPEDLIVQQLQTVFADFSIGAVKTGALGTAGVINAIAGFFSEHMVTDLVIDPVMISKHGHKLISDDAVGVLKSRLLPLARVTTPNLPEAEVLAGMSNIRSRQAMITAAEHIAESGCRAVLIKGGHSDAEPADLLWDGGVITWLEGERIATPHTHGTGCTFSAAIAASLVRGLSLENAALDAKRYISGAIAHHQLFGRGYNPVNHFWQSNARFGVV
jgi:hydroxymethylpyrimidine/phosphomethylpyrimidine kinase